VLARQSDEVQDFLLSTSVLERMSGPLCEAVTNSGGGEATLRRLEAANLFIVPLDNTHTWFRYHHLFAELLRRELRARRPGMEPSLNERAARWLAAESLVDEAVPHAVAAGAWDLVIEIGTVHGLRLFVEGRSSTFRRLYGAPDEELRKRPEAALGFAWLAVLSGDLRQARRWLDLAEDAYRCDPENATRPTAGCGTCRQPSRSQAASSSRWCTRRPGTPPSPASPPAR
jgi:LuxR family maltose regulon positive regulatory protein